MEQRRWSLDLPALGTPAPAAFCERLVAWPLSSPLSLPPCDSDCFSCPRCAFPCPRSRF